RSRDLPKLGDDGFIKRWLCRQQSDEWHPFTGIYESGWAWTDLPGGVPDADDTAGAVLAVRALVKKPSKGASYTEMFSAALGGLLWLEQLQNADGGWPTFCRGWSALPFDRSGADLTGHVLRAIAAWPEIYQAGPYWKVHYERRFAKLTAPALSYLVRTQRPDGSWLPLWFGNQHAP